ncbi:hypothetical protein EUX98_g3413 [Antrodiella citrinella]|uniref:tRNA-guanine(15) transglycosylase-like domain-containing protein n=1 Tax=Antrodiella citrinella TaxID=2447956 RepID=A0A4S4MYQ0_9APHY|nr:hypothetical protein EUX98_g3413 [Antrodiella citrinella]
MHPVFEVDPTDIEGFRQLLPSSLPPRDVRPQDAPRSVAIRHSIGPPGGIKHIIRRMQKGEPQCWFPASKLPRVADPFFVDVPADKFVARAHYGIRILTRNLLQYAIKLGIAKQYMSISSLAVLLDGVTMLPTFMPVATQAAIKGLTSQQVEALGINLILNNTYHLNLRPGMQVLKEVGGAHKFQGWRHNLLTDSGGFQLVSLSKFTKITEEGALFSSPFDGAPTMLTPEESISIQHSIGADIIMQLDDVVSSLTVGPRVEESMWRTIRWLDRCIDTHDKSGKKDVQNLFAIVQGGLDPVLRNQCLDEMVKRRDQVAGYAVGGLSGGEEKDVFWRVIKQCADKLPEDTHAVTQHNLVFQARLMGGVRDAILDGTFPTFLRTFFKNYFGDAGYPEWCVNALKSVGVDLLEGDPSAKIQAGAGAKWERVD